MSNALKFVAKDIDLTKLDINPENLRFKSGTAVDGIKVTDTYNLGTMKDAIKAEGGIPGRLVVEQYTAADGTTRYKILAGNRRGRAAMEMVNDSTISVELLEKLKNVPCNVYKDLTDRQRRDLVNDQRSQKYMRSELDVYAWKLQSAGMTYPEIAMYIWQQMATYAAGGAKKIVDVEKCGTEADRQKEITTWLKGTLDNIILSCGKMGPRVRRALLLTDMALDGISPVTGTDDKGQPILELPEFKPTQGRCGELRKAMKNDPTWTPENGGPEFNALIAKYSRQDKGIDENGEKIPPNPSRPSAELLVEQIGRTKSSAAKAALDYARGLTVMHYADVDDEAFRVEQLFAMAIKHRNDVKNDTVKELLNIFLTGDTLTLESFLAKHS